MNILIKICAIVIVFLFLSLLLKNYNNGLVLFLRIAVILIIFLLISEELSEFVAKILNMFSLLEIEGYYIQLVAKVAAISIVSDFVCDILRDNNEIALSRVIEFSAKIFIIALSFPMMNSLVAFCIEIIN